MVLSYQGSSVFPEYCHWCHRGLKDFFETWSLFRGSLDWIRSEKGVWFYGVDNNLTLGRRSILERPWQLGRSCARLVRRIFQTGHLLWDPMDVSEATITWDFVRDLPRQCPSWASHQSWSGFKPEMCRYSRLVFSAVNFYSNRTERSLQRVTLRCSAFLTHSCARSKFMSALLLLCSSGTSRELVTRARRDEPALGVTGAVTWNKCVEPARRAESLLLRYVTPPERLTSGTAPAS